VDLGNCTLSPIVALGIDQFLKTEWAESQSFGLISHWLIMHVAKLVMCGIKKCSPSLLDTRRIVLRRYVVVLFKREGKD
jgi:hypothetical protein